MATIWVVEQGEYSDYAVVGVFSTKELAEKMRDVVNAEDPLDPATVDAWPLDPFAKEIRKGRKCYRVWMRSDGVVPRHGVSLVSPQSPRYVLTSSTWEEKREIRVVCWATDETHAIKITNEIRAQKIASGEL